MGRARVGVSLKSESERGGVPTGCWTEVGACYDGCVALLLLPFLGASSEETAMEVDSAHELFAKEIFSSLFSRLGA